MELHDRIWADGLEAAFGAGGVMNDHHGVGLKLAPVHGAPARRVAGCHAPHQAGARSGRDPEPRQARTLKGERRTLEVRHAQLDARRSRSTDTIERLGKSGYDAIEISGEPSVWDTDEVKGLMDEHGRAAAGAR